MYFVSIFSCWVFRSNSDCFYLSQANVSTVLYIALFNSTKIIIDFISVYTQIFQLRSTTKAQHKVQSGLLLDVVIRKSPAIL